MSEDKVSFPTLHNFEKSEFDAAIIGGGMAGILSAYLLVKAGKKVILLEKNELGQGATQATTAFITEVIDTAYADLIRTLGIEKAKMTARSHEAAIDFIETIVKEESIGCGFMRCDNYEYANEESETKDLQEEFDACQKLGIKTELHLEKKEEVGKELCIRHDGYLEWKNQAKFQPMKFLYQIASLAVKYGAEIYEHSEVLGVEAAPARVNILLKGGQVKAKYALIATYEPFEKPLELYFKKAFYTTYVLRLEGPDHLKEAIYEDTLDPYHYFRVDEEDGKKIVVLGGEDHRSDLPVDPDKNFAALIEYAQKVLETDKIKILEKWTGPILEPVDGLPFIGPLENPRIFYAMAFSGNGMTYSAITALVFRDTVSGQKNDWLDIYHADRIPGLKALAIKARDFIKEMAGGAVKNTLRRKE